MSAPAAAPLAALPMNDWPEVRPHWDALWSAIAARLCEAGVPAPETLTRGLGLMEGWLSPTLVLGQTCGLPYVRHLRRRVTLLGTPDFAVPGCPPGWYDSVVVVRADDPREGTRAFAGARLAVNGADSQSGTQAMMHHVRALPVPHFGRVSTTGAHEASARAVAEGRADIAAIDHTTWRLIAAHRPFAAGLRVMERTDPTPGLPFVAAAGAGAAHADAVAAGVADAPEAAREALGLAGYVRTVPEDYDVIAARDAAARGVSAAHGLARP